ncbi:Mitochondrial substrate carrier family protein [Perilla frutescens var. hirtella]|nr:Mitochondrial substrate carrier family protein [Perilla frutescens var. hirtella]
MRHYLMCHHRDIGTLESVLIGYWDTFKFPNTSIVTDVPLPQHPAAAGNGGQLLPATASLADAEFSDDEDESPNILMKIVAGAFFGAVATAATNPVEVLKMGRLTTKGSIQEFQKIASEEGVTAFWKGARPEMTRDALFTASQLATYDENKMFVIRWTSLKDGFFLHLIEIKWSFSTIFPILVIFAGDLIYSTIFYEIEHGKEEKDPELQFKGPMTRLRAKKLQAYLQASLRRKFELHEDEVKGRLSLVNMLSIDDKEGSMKTVFIKYLEELLSGEVRRARSSYQHGFTESIQSTIPTPLPPSAAHTVMFLPHKSYQVFKSSPSSCLHILVSKKWKTNIKIVESCCPPTMCRSHLAVPFSADPTVGFSPTLYRFEDLLTGYTYLAPDHKSKVFRLAKITLKDGIKLLSNSKLCSFCFFDYTCLAFLFSKGYHPIEVRVPQLVQQVQWQLHMLIWLRPDLCCNESPKLLEPIKMAFIAFTRFCHDILVKELPAYLILLKGYRSFLGMNIPRFHLNLIGPTKPSGHWTTTAAENKPSCSQQSLEYHRRLLQRPLGSVTCWGARV